MSSSHKRTIGPRQIRKRAYLETQAMFQALDEGLFSSDEDETDSLVSFPVPILGTNGSNLCEVGQHEDISVQDVSNSRGVDNDSLNNLNLEEPLEQHSTLYERQSSAYDIHYLRSNSSSPIASGSSGNEESDLPHKLREWNLKFNISHDACRSLLHILKPMHKNLPLDPRTLNRTPRITPSRLLINGSYIHIGLTEGLLKRLNFQSLDCSNTPSIHLDLNIDGISLTNSGRATDAWPILCRSLDLTDKRPFVVGIFVGTGKPNSVQDYLQDLVAECLNLLKEGLNFNGTLINVKIRSFICDAPARQYLKKVVGHAGYNACERCEQNGTYAFNRMCYSTTTGKSRTDEDFIKQSDPDHHIGNSPLLELRIGLVSQFPLDPFHLILEGVVKRFIKFLLKGTKSGIRLSSHDTLIISERLIQLGPHVPREFARKPMGLNELSKWKGTLFRFFLIYGGCVVMKGIVPNSVYKIFLMLQIAITILSVPKLIKSEKQIQFAKELLTKFVQSSCDKNMFDIKFCSYVVHSTLHLTDDVCTFGDISTFSSFPFESYLGHLKQLLRSPTKPVQQLARRLTEQNYLYDFGVVDSFGPERPVVGTNCYKLFNFSNFVLSSFDRKDRFFLYKCSVGFVNSIQKTHDGTYVIIANICDTKTDFFKYPCNSSLYGIFNLGTVTWAKENVVVPVSEVDGKCVVIPCQKDSIAIPLFHSF